MPLSEEYFKFYAHHFSIIFHIIVVSTDGPWIMDSTISTCDDNNCNTSMDALPGMGDVTFSV